MTFLQCMMFFSISSLELLELELESVAREHRNRNLVLTYRLSRIPVVGQDITQEE